MGWVWTLYSRFVLYLWLQVGHNSHTAATIHQMSHVTARAIGRKVQ